MNESPPDFYVASAEGYETLEEPRRAYRVKRLRGDKRDDYVLIRIDPPLIGQQFGLGDKDVDYLVVATRHVGATLFPVGSWPVSVHVGLPPRDILARRDPQR